MRGSTIHHPALLGHGGRFAREARHLCAQAGSQGLFDLPVELDGLQGHTRAELAAVRAFTMLGEAFGLHGEALAEWHRLLAYGDEPRFECVLLRDFRRKLPDLLMRAQTLALYQDRAGRGGHYMRVWRHVKVLHRLLDDWAAAAGYVRLAVDVHALACLPPVDARALHRVWKSARLYRQLQAHAPHLVWLMPGVHTLAGADVPLTGMTDMRARLMAAGLTKAGWRWLAVNAPYRLYTSLQADPFLQIVMANVFGVIGPHFAPCDLFCGYVWEVVLEFMSSGWSPRDCALLIHAAWRHFESIEARDDRDFFMLSAFHRTMDWILDFGWAPDANQRRAGWPAMGAGVASGGWRRSRAARAVVGAC